MSRCTRPLLWLGLLVVWSRPAFAQTANYRHQRAVVLNDLRATPGAARTTDTQVICTTATGTVRHVTAQMKRQVCTAYGVPADQCNGRFVEIDHLIPLALGGSNAITNLWPQPFKPSPGAHEKDNLENYLHRQVCGGRGEPRCALDLA